MVWQSRSVGALVHPVEAGNAGTRTVRKSVPPALPNPPLLDRVREALRIRHHSRRPEEAYVAWIRWYLLFEGKQHPAELSGPDVTRFLSALAIERPVATEHIFRRSARYTLPQGVVGHNAATLIEGFQKRLPGEFRSWQQAALRHHQRLSLENLSPALISKIMTP